MRRREYVSVSWRTRGVHVECVYVDVVWCGVVWCGVKVGEKWNLRHNQASAILGLSLWLHRWESGMR